MITYSLKKNSAVIDLENSIYPYPIILETVHNFLESCWITIDKSGEKYTIGIESKEKDESTEIVSAFFNFMNGLLFSHLAEETKAEIHQPEDDCECEDESKKEC
ncbi:MAG TPA: hypothetical protein ENN46_01650 [Candidatus Woesearchaeota archaeon]|nr:hypothetical protein [Candidatus Woesearchaeota archaeon]